MAVTRCDLTKLTKRVISVLNAGVAASYGTTVADDRRHATEIADAILAADAQVCLAIAECTGHGYRSLFMADSADLDHGSQLPDHLGSPGQVRIKRSSVATLYRAGIFDKDLSLADIQRWRDNPGQLYGAGTIYDPGDYLPDPPPNPDSYAVTDYYRIEGSEIFFTGYRARVRLANVTRTTACQAPDVFEDAVVALAVAMLIKEGDEAPFLSAFMQTGQGYLVLIRSGAMTIPPLQLEQAA